MSEIKLKFWNTIVHRMSKVYTLEELHKEEVNWLVVKPLRFTGLRDKKGFEIWEGSLVKARRGNTGLGNMNDIYVIHWSEKYACFCYLCVKSDNKWRVGKIAESNTHPYFVTPSITDVIGCIYENQELTTH